MERVLALIDGEHYLPVTKEAIEKLNSVSNQEVVAAMFLGGTEKIGDFDEVKDYLNLPLYFLDQKSDFQKLVQEIKTKFKITTIFDLSDDPVISSQDRMDFACAALFEGRCYKGADFQFTPIKFLKAKKPVLSVIGSAKRVGKTAVAGYIARVIKETEWTPCILTMGRGGPEIPEVIRGDQLIINAESLLQVANEGKHAASDYWEDALTSRIITIGCRRCAGGLAGAPYLDNVKQGIKIAEKLPIDLIIAEGSGPTIPPVKGDATIIIVGSRPLSNVKDYLNPYRIKLSDLAIISNCEFPLASESDIKVLIDALKEINPKIKICCTIFRPKVLGDIRGKNVFYAATMPVEMMDIVVKYLEQQYKCNVVGTTVHLANRAKLRDDLKELAHADLLLTELKAAAIDVAAKTALQKDKPTIFCDNELHVKEYPKTDMNSIQSLNSYLIEITQMILKGR